MRGKVRLARGEPPFSWKLKSAASRAARTRFPLSTAAGGAVVAAAAQVVSPLGLPCNPPPWGVLTALDLGSRKILWQVPLGTTEELNPLGIASRTGTPTFGGPLATASGLVFIGARRGHERRPPSGGKQAVAGIAAAISYILPG